MRFTKSRLIRWKMIRMRRIWWKRMKKRRKM